MSETLKEYHVSHGDKRSGVWLEGRLRRAKNGGLVLGIMLSIWGDDEENGVVLEFTVKDEKSFERFKTETNRIRSMMAEANIALNDYLAVSDMDGDK